MRSSLSTLFSNETMGSISHFAGGEVNVENETLSVNEGDTVMFCVRLTGGTGSAATLTNPLIVRFVQVADGKIPGTYKSCFDIIKCQMS